jgi:hypothetical protein
VALLPLESPDFGLVTIGTVSLHTPAWQCTNSYLLTDPPPRRRRNRTRPGLPGVYGGVGWPDEWSVELEIAINGWWDRNGNPHADPAAGAEINWRYLVDNVYDAVDYPATGSETQGRIGVGVTSAIPGYVYLGYVQLNSFKREPRRDATCAYLEVTLPSGGLALVEP